MAIFIATNNIFAVGKHAINPGDGSHYVAINESVFVTTTGSFDVVHLDSGKSRVEVFGHVIGAGENTDGISVGNFVKGAPDKGGGNFVSVGPNGSVDGRIGVAAYGGNNTVVNKGTISGSETGVFLSVGITDLYNMGTITGEVWGIQADAEGIGSFKIVNSGWINAHTVAIDLFGSGRLINSGIISSGIFVSNQINLSNTGTIIGFVGGGKNNDIVYNAGEIQGTVSLSLGGDRYDGSGGRVLGEIDLGPGNDQAVGGAITDSIGGGEGDDVVSGGGGDDVIFGNIIGAVRPDGMDEYDGGSGIDTFAIFDNGSEFSAGNGTVIDLTSGLADGSILEQDTLLNIENARGSAGEELIIGSEVANILDGVYGNDVLKGLDGDDVLIGSRGTDVLVGGKGRDLLTGGADRDRFVYNSIVESTFSTSGRDILTGFFTGDVIDLKAIDASTRAAGNQAFTFIGGALFSGVAGQLRVTHGGAATFVFADVNGDDFPDFSIRIRGSYDFSSADFVL